MDKKYDKMVFNDEINEIGKLHIGKIDTNPVNNVVPKLKEFGEPSIRNTHFIRPKYVTGERTTNFSFGFITREITTFEKLVLL